MASPSKPNRREVEIFRRPTARALLWKAFTEQNEDWDTEELLDVIHWQRQALGLVCGLAWGLVPLTGIWAFAGFITLNIIAVMSWWRAQRIDEDEHGGTQALVIEGLPPSIGLFTVVWVLTYTVATAAKSK